MRLLSETAARVRAAQSATPNLAEALSNEATALEEIAPLLCSYDASFRKRLHHEANLRRRRRAPGG